MSAFSNKYFVIFFCTARIFENLEKIKPLFSYSFLCRLSLPSFFILGKQHENFDLSLKRSFYISSSIKLLRMQEEIKFYLITILLCIALPWQYASVAKKSLCKNSCLLTNKLHNIQYLLRMLDRFLIKDSVLQRFYFLQKLPNLHP